MKRYRIYQVDAFTTHRFEGNPAGVVANADGLTEAQMQALARELNNSETAFIFSPSAADHDVWIRFFTPKAEVPICGHATISAHYVRAVEKDLPSCTLRQRVGVGILPVEIVREASAYRITMTQGRIELSEPFDRDILNEILGAFHLHSDDLDGRCPVQIVSTGHSKVMIGIRSKERLNALQPNLIRLRTISQQIGCNGFFVFSLASDEGDILSHGRMFAPAIGIPEDPVTGNANGPLGAYLVHHGIVNTSGGSLTFKAKQGEAIGRPGIVTVTVETEHGTPRKVQVSGDAVIAFKTEITL